MATRWIIKLQGTEKSADLLLLSRDGESFDMEYGLHIKTTGGTCVLHDLSMSTEQLRYYSTLHNSIEYMYFQYSGNTPDIRSLSFATIGAYPEGSSIEGVQFLTLQLFQEKHSS